MGKNRRRDRKTSTRDVKKRVFIVCEGKKTEPYYFTHFIREFNFRGKPVVIKVVKEKKINALGLIKNAAKRKETDIDEAWAVFDLNGYDKHPEAFKLAGDLKVNIAFSSISFEIWILLHFEYSTKAYKKSGDVIRHLLNKKYLDYSKTDPGLYDAIKVNLVRAEKNARQLRRYQQKENAQRARYLLNPYTDVDMLLQAIRQLAG